MPVPRRRSAGAFSFLDLTLTAVILFVAAGVLIPAHTLAKWTSAHTFSSTQLVTIEAAFRTQDADRNGIQDYWTRDVAGLHALHDAQGRPIAMLDVEFARSDSAPGRAYAELGGVCSPRKSWAPGAWHGSCRSSFVRSMLVDPAGRPYVDNTLPPPKAGNAPSGSCTNLTRFAFTQFPAVYLDGGFVLVFVVREDGVVWMKDLGVVSPVLDWRVAAPENDASGWSQYGG